MMNQAFTFLARDCIRNDTNLPVANCAHLLTTARARQKIILQVTLASDSQGLFK